MNIQEVFKERLTNDVHKIMRHIRGSEQDPTVLDGTIMLTIENGVLVDIQMASNEGWENLLTVGHVTQGELDVTEPIADADYPKTKVKPKK